VTRNRINLRRELTAIAVLLALATPTGSHALVALSDWAGHQLAQSIVSTVPKTVPAQHTENTSRQETNR
jgi:hypothetical protein